MSIFSSIGLGDLGLKAAGFRTALAVELDPRRTELFRLNFPETHVVQADASRIVNWNELWEQSPNEGRPFIALITPPCQAASTLGCRGTDKKPNDLAKVVVKVACELEPQWIIVENVARYATQKISNDSCGDRRSGRVEVEGYLRRSVKALGYSYSSFKLCASDFGLPQNRTRWFAICGRNGRSIEIPAPSHGPEGRLALNTLRDAIGDQQPLRAGQSSYTDKLHFARSHPPRHLRWMRATPEGESAYQNRYFWLRPTVFDSRRRSHRLILGHHNTYKRMNWDEPAPTVTANSHKISGTRTVHPTQGRVLTLREILRIQGVGLTVAENGKPRYDDAAFKIPADIREPVLRYALGEGVPPRLVEILATECLNSSRAKRARNTNSSTSVRTAYS